MCDRGDHIVQELIQLLDSDPLIDEFGITILDGVDTVLEEHKLGMHLQAYLPAIAHASERLMELRALRDKTAAGWQKEMDSVSKVVCLLSGFCYTSWNERKRLLLTSHRFKSYKDVQRELHFSSLCQTKHPKSEFTWGHRRWLVSLFQENAKKEQVFELLDKELEVSLAIAKLYEKNYYCWSYREWLLDRVRSHITSTSVELGKTILLKDIRRLTDFASSNPSDCGASFYFCRLLLKYAAMYKPHELCEQHSLRSETQSSQQEQPNVDDSTSQDALINSNSVSQALAGDVDNNESGTRDACEGCILLNSTLDAVLGKWRRLEVAGSATTSTHKTLQELATKIRTVLQKEHDELL
eukprot:m.134649 g.134649  ORF g.134649 m.134649 type:complete len:354 (-) comp14698_c0_seq2:3203-4264(-)